eukprot:2051774-Prymnesium_polylepis.1
MERVRAACAWVARSRSREDVRAAASLRGGSLRLRTSHSRLARSALAQFAKNLARRKALARPPPRARRRAESDRHRARARGRAGRSPNPRPRAPDAALALKSAWDLFGAH